MESKESPSTSLLSLADHHGVDVYGQEFPALMDESDPLRGFREKFAYPCKKTLPHISRCLSDKELAQDCVYMCGNSLGLKPRKADTVIMDQMDKWANTGVEMHFEEPLPAALCDMYGRESLGRLVGASPECVVLMNGLTVNLHLLLLSFYKPQGNRTKILIEDHAFPSDRYAMRSQIELRGQCPDQDLIQLRPREGENCLRTEDILKVIKQQGPTIAVVCLSGVQYYTGQKFDMKVITQAAQDQGCLVGWDLAHAVGNVELELDDWGVDFACWCTYKYLNSGPGCIGGAYVNSRHDSRSKEGQLRGWWSSTHSSRFAMNEHCEVAPGIEGFRLCNPPPVLVCLVVASLEIFDEAGMPRLLAKQRLLTGYLEMLLTKHFIKQGTDQSGPSARIITPTNPEERGCQLSLSFSLSLKKVHEELTKRGVVCDIRLPHAMRLAPVPLYNSYSDVYKFVTTLKDVFDNLAKQPLKEG